jgi:transcriptional antiterminator RfaH
MEAWYAVHTKGRQERFAAEHLTRQQYENFLPLICSPKRRRGRWCEVIEPLFPGYLFVRMDLLRQNAAPIRSTRGVIGMVRFGATMPPVPAALIDPLLAAKTDRDGVIRQTQMFEPGERVRIVSGALAGLEAIFVSLSGQERAQLLLELLGRTNRVVVSPHQLARTS